MSTLPSLNQALVLMNQQAYAEARSICQQHLARTPDNFNARHLLGLVQLKSGNPIAACRELQRATKLPVQPRFKAQALSNLALALQARERCTEALETIEQALTLVPDEPAFRLNQLALLERLNHWQAIEQLGRSQPALLQYPEARLTLAVALRHRQNSPQALELLQPLLAEGDTDTEAEWALNLCLCQRSDELIRTLQAHRCPPERLLQIADYIAEESDPSRAAALYALVIRQQPDNTHARHMLDAAAGHCTAEAPRGYVQALYNTHADQFEHRLQQRLEYKAPELLARLLSKQIQPPAQGLEVLDLGCGTGLCGKALKSALPVRHLKGCDLAQKMLELAAQKRIYDQLECDDLLSVLSRSGPVDLITATDVLIYTGDLAPICTSVAATLRAGGTFAFTVEAAEGCEPVSLQPSGRYRHSRKHIEAVAAAAGLKVQHCSPFPLRLEHEQPITGLMVLLERPAQPEGNRVSN